MEICNQWFSSFLITKPFEEVEKEFRAQLAFLKAMGAKIDWCIRAEPQRTGHAGHSHFRPQIRDERPGVGDLLYRYEQTG